MMKKVLFTATVDSHILAFHIPFLKYFKEQGYEVHVATNGDVEIPYCDVKHTVSFERSPFKLNNLRAIKQLKKIVDADRYDMGHTHTPMGSVVTRLAAITARKNGTSVIYTAHGFHFFKGAPLINWIIFYPIEKILAHYTDTLITINQEDYELAKGKFRTCVEYVPGVGIYEEKFNFKLSEHEKNELRESLGIRESDFVMIYPAELSKRKRQIWLINALGGIMTKHTNIHLLLPGKDSLNDACQNLAKESDSESQIHFLGFRNDIPKLLSISNLAISSAAQEGLPVNIMEAMYVGLPIVVTDCRGNRDLIENGSNGYVVGLYDQKEFADKVMSICKDKALAKKLSKNAREGIKPYYLDAILTSMSRIYFSRVKHE